ncbi:MAG: LCP family protein [Clostridiales bacterium]|nr:LCP family protein [Clostridiales bacterium]
MSGFHSHKPRIRFWLVGIILVAAVLFGWHTILRYRERKATEAMIEEANAKRLAETAETEPEESDSASLDLSQDTVTWQGKTYRRNTYIKAILCMGVDRSDDMQGTREAGYAGQADGIFLLAHDTARNQIQILMIPRDTMTEIMTTDWDGNELGIQVDHLTLAFAHGDGNTGSCDYMTTAVSNLLYGLEMDRYLAVDTTVISTLNDAVGGVTVTVPTQGMEKTDPAFVYGEQVTLYGSQAERFVRYRDTAVDNSALYRMNQHRQYITGFFDAVKEQSRKDSQTVTRLFDLIQDYMITDMPKEEYLKIGVDVLTDSTLKEDDFFTLPGYGVTTDLYDEYYVNKQQAVPIILQLFYRETS